MAFLLRAIADNDMRLAAFGTNGTAMLALRELPMNFNWNIKFLTK